MMSVRVNYPVKTWIAGLLVGAGMVGCFGKPMEPNFSGLTPSDEVAQKTGQGGDAAGGSSSDLLEETFNYTQLVDEALQGLSEKGWIDLQDLNMDFTQRLNESLLAAGWQVEGEELAGDISGRGLFVETTSGLSLAVFMSPDLSDELNLAAEARESADGVSSLDSSQFVVEHLKKEDSNLYITVAKTYYEEALGLIYFVSEFNTDTSQMEIVFSSRSALDLGSIMSISDYLASVEAQVEPSQVFSYDTSKDISEQVEGNLYGCAEGTLRGEYESACDDLHNQYCSADAFATLVGMEAPPEYIGSRTELCADLNQIIEERVGGSSSEDGAGDEEGSFDDGSLTFEHEVSIP